MDMAVITQEANHDLEIESNNRKGMGPKLYNGALSGSLQVIQQFNWMDRTTTTGNNVLHIHLGKRLHLHNRTIVGTPNREFIQAIVNDESGYSLLWKKNDEGDIPLHVAARFGHAVAVEEFLRRAALVNEEEVNKMVAMTNKKKNTALHEAVKLFARNRGVSVGCSKVVKLLVEADANGLCHEPNDMGETPLYLAAENGNDSSVDCILKSCTLSARNIARKGPFGQSAVHAAIGLAKPATVQKMMDIDKSVLRVQDIQGQTPLHCAAGEINQLKLLQVLLDYDDENESAVYIQDNMGRTALHIATLTLNWDGIKKLIAACPDSIEIVDNNGQNVVHYAAKFECLIEFSTFTNLGYFDKLVNDKDIDGNTPLHILAATVPKVPSHLCFLYLPMVIHNNQMDGQAYNVQNLTAGDILASNNSFHRYVIPFIRWSRLYTQLGIRVFTYKSYAGDLDEDSTDLEKQVKLRKKEGQYHLVVATLIASASFTAGFALPGGLNQNGENLGMAVLARKAAFKAFLVSDTIAFVYSSLAVMFYFLLANRKNVVHTNFIFIMASNLTLHSLGALMIAFVTGVFAVTSLSHGLSLSVLLISVLFFILFVILYVLWIEIPFFHLVRAMGIFLQSAAIVVAQAKDKL